MSAKRYRIRLFAVTAALTAIVVAAIILSRPSPTFELTPADIAAIRAVVGDETGAEITNMRIEPDGNVFVFAGDGLGHRQFQLQKTDGTWHLVGETLFYAFRPQGV